MILLIAAAIGSGLTTAMLLVPFSPLAALIIAPLAASASAILACLLLAWRRTRDDRQAPVLDAQTDMMVAALRDVAQQSKAATPTAESGSRHKAA